MHIDWLTVRQTHRADCPILADSYLERIDIETGEMLWGTYVGRSLEGSFKSGLRIRSDGRTVEVSGNPSRWNREENLFGVRSVDAAIAVYNTVLVDLGLPPFNDDDRTLLGPRLLQKTDSLARDGLIISRVDITQNYSTGGPRNSEHALHALRAFRHRNRPPHDYGSTLMWGGKGSRYVSFKYYLKGPEMRKHVRQWTPYLKDVCEFVEGEGVVRFEVCCKAEFLRRSGLDRADHWTVEVMEAILRGYSMHNKAGATRSSMNDIRESLIEAGLSELRAERCQQAALAFLNGHKFRSSMSTSTFYRLRKDLLLVGIDINADLNISALRFTCETVQLSETVEPSWYKTA